MGIRDFLKRVMEENRAYYEEKNRAYATRKACCSECGLQGIALDKETGLCLDCYKKKKLQETRDEGWNAVKLSFDALTPEWLKEPIRQFKEDEKDHNQESEKWSEEKENRFKDAMRGPAMAESDRFRKIHQQQIALTNPSMWESGNEDVPLENKEILFIRYLNGRSFDLSNIAGYWTHEYKLDYRLVMDKLFRGGYLTTAPYEYIVKKKTMYQLKSLLSANGLSTGGKKADLVNRVLSSISKEEFRAMYPMNHFALTDKGQSLMEKAEFFHFFHSNNYIPLDMSSRIDKAQRIKEENPDMSNDEIALLLQREAFAPFTSLQAKSFAQHEALGIGDKYQYLATLDLKTCDKCGALDRKTFYYSEKQVGVNCPPMHDGCRCITTVYFPPDEISALFGKGKRAARDPKTNKTYYVDGDITWSQWKQEIERDK